MCSVGELGHDRQRFRVSRKVVGQDGLLDCSKQSLAPHRCTCFTSFTGDVAAAERATAVLRDCPLFGELGPNVEALQRSEISLGLAP